MLIDWENEKRLGTMPDAKLGAILGCTRARVQQIRREKGIRSFNTPAAELNDWGKEPLLGLVDDAELAKAYGVSTSTVANARHVRGIPPARSLRRGALGNKDIDWDKETRLGKMSDQRLAEALRCRRSDVTRERKRLGIRAMRAK